MSELRNTLHRRLHIRVGGQFLLAASLLSAAALISTRAQAETDPGTLVATGAPIQLLPVSMQSAGDTVGATALDATVQPAVLAAAPAPSADDPNRVTDFDHDRLLAKAELDQLRGGFSFNGVTVRFGFEVQQFVDHTIQNDLSVGQVELKNGVLQNSFNVTHNGTTISTNSLPPNGFNALTTANGGQTTLSLTVNNGAIQNVVQNAANNQVLQTVTTVNVSTEGLASQLHNSISQLQMIQTMQNTLWLHH